MSTHRRFLQILSVTVIMSIMLSAFATPVALAQSGDGIKRERNAQTGKVSFIGPASGRALPAAKVLGVSPSARLADPAMALAKRFGPEFGLKNPAGDLKEKTANRSNNGRLAVHYQQAYQGIPVIAGELIVNTNENGDLYSISGEVSAEISLSTTPTVDTEQARQTALEGIARWYQKLPEDFFVSEPELWIYDESLLQPSTRPVELVWRLEVTPKDASMPVRELVLVNAHRGSLSLHFNQVDMAWSFDEQRDNAPRSTFTPQPTEASTEPPETAGTATPTPTPSQSGEDVFSPHAENELESLEDGTWYVSTAGNDSNSCLEPAAPCATIQAAINKASGGNTIRIAEGTYYYTSINANPNVVIINKSITLSGGWQSDFSSQTGASIIDGQNTNNGILANAAGSTILIDHLVVRNSRTGSDSGGIYLYAANFTLQHSSIINNTGGRGAGIFMLGNANLTVQNSTISGNQAGSSGGGIHAVNGTITINNSTIAYNRSNAVGGGIRPESGTVLVRNSILAKNTATTSGPNCAGSISSSDHNIMEDTAGCTITSGTGDRFNVDPLIDSTLSGTLPLHTLQATSPAVNAGDNATCLSMDQRGVARPQGSACDIGAYELLVSKSISVLGGSNQTAAVSTAFALSLSVLVIDEFGDPASGLMVTFTAPASGASGIFADTSTNSTTAITDASGHATSAILTANNQPGSFTVHATAEGYSSPAMFSLGNFSTNFYVSSNGSDSNSCDSPALPCETINGAIGKAVAGSTIAVASGTYTGSGTEVVLLNKNVALSGGWDNTFSLQTGTSIIDGQGARRAVVNTAAGASIENFTIQGGYHATRGGGIYNNNGALTLSNSILSGNVSAGSGGGVSNIGTLTINNTSISGNRGGTAGLHGGGGGAGIESSNGTVTMNDSSVSGNVMLGGYQSSGIYNSIGSFTLNNSTVSANTGADAIYNSGTLTLKNSTVSRNAKIGISGRAILQNSILANNSTSGSGQDCAGTITSSGYNLISKTTGCTFTPGTGDQTNVDPLLSTYWIGSPAYHTLLSGSPAIDAGNPLTCLSTDQRGLARPQGAVCDIGAYEYTTPGVAASLGITNGNDQRTALSLPFTLPLIVYVVDDAGSPVSGVEITFTAPASGPGGTFADTGTNVTTVSTNTDGVAISSTFTANAQLGTYQVTATGTGLPGSVNFTLTNGAWFVSPSGNDSNSCSVPTAPCLTLNGAIAKAYSVDVIKVASGIYAPASINKSLTLQGGWDSTFTSQTGYSIVQGSATVDGITTTGANVSMARFIVQNSRYGIYHTAGNLSFERGALINNKNGLYNSNSDATFTNTTMSGNQSSSSTTGSAISNGSGTVRIQYSTIANNTGSYAIYSTGSSARIEIGNSILAGNSVGDCYAGSTNMTSMGHNIFGRSPACSGSTSVVPDASDQLGVNPQLSALFPMGYHSISSASPAVDRADPASCPATDQRGVTRPEGTACDIGAYEYATPGVMASFGIASGSNQYSGPSLPFQMPLVVYVVDAFGNPVSGAEVTFTAPASGPGGTFADTGTNATMVLTNSSGVAIASTFTANAQLGSYNVVATVPGLPGSASFALTNGAWFVSPSGNDSNSCSVPTAPCLTLNGAIGKSVDGHTIVIAVGTYAPASISKSLRLSGGWDSTFTSQTGYSIVQGSATVDGITTTGANVSMARFIVQNSRNGIYHTAGNLSFERGALINNKNGIYNSNSDTIFTNTTISGNQSSGSNTGSAIVNSSGTIRIQYSTITNNTGNYAIYSTNSNARVEIGNSILAGNSVGDCFVASMNMTSTGNNIFGRSPACFSATSFVPAPSDQLGVDPQLYSLLPLGYHSISSTSPAVDRADPASCPATDQRGLTRPEGALCDIGAFEYKVPGPAASFGIVSGSDQHSGPSLPFMLPFAVYVIDAFGTPVSGAEVTFTAPASGPGGTFVDTGASTTVAVSNDSGIATSATFIANSQTGSYNVVATVPGLSGSASFALTNAVWFVALTGSDTNSCNSSTSPCLTINGASGKAVNGDAVLVAVGTYAPASISKSLTFLGGWDSVFTSQTGYSTVQGSATVDGITVSGANVSISRFVVQGSKYGINHTGGTLNFAQGALINNKNGIYNSSGDTTFTNTTISGNQSSISSTGSGITNSSGTVRIQYSTITNNTGGYAIYNINSSNHIEIGNSILAGNANGDCYMDSNIMTSTGHNIFGRSPVCSNSAAFIPDATDQLGVNPQLASLLPVGYHPLLFTSPAVDHASPASCPATDQRGIARPQGAACDIGAFEYVAIPGEAVSFGVVSGFNQHSGPSLPFQFPLAVYVTDAFGNPVSGVSVNFTAPASGPSGTFADTHNNITVVTTDGSGIATSSVFTANSQMGSYNVVATVPGLPGSVSFALSNVAWFVSPTGNDSNSCSVPTAPCLTLNGVIAKAVNGDAIRVATGTYEPTSFSKSLALQGGWDSTFTSQTGYSTIQGSATVDGITTSGANVSMTRLVVQNSKYGVYHSAGTLHFDQGALIHNKYGMYNYNGDITLTNTTISGNQSTASTGRAISNSSGTVRIQYSTISNNGGSEAIWSRNSAAQIIIGDSILAGNTGGDCSIEESTNMISTGHNIFGNSPVCSDPSTFIPDPTDQVGVDPELLPLFVLGYHPIASTSPAVDLASSTSCPTTDQRGVTRPQGAACDIGAVEYTASGSAASLGIVSGSNQHSGPSLPFQLPLAVYVTDAFGNPVSGVNVTFTAPASGPSVTFADTQNNITIATTNDNGIATSSMATANSQMGSYNVVATVSGVSEPVSFMLANVALFVAPTGNNSNSCSAPSSPCLTLNGAIAKAVNGDAILVAVGTYAPASISKSLTLQGGWDSTFTSQTGYSVIQGSATVDGITTSAANISVSRFVVQNSKNGVYHSTGSLRFDQGALINNTRGMYSHNGDITLTNTTISGNHSSGANGSAIVNNLGTVRIQYSTITNNTGSYAIYGDDSSAHIEIGNSILAGNAIGDCYVKDTNMTSTGHNIFGRYPACASLDSFVADPTDHVGVDPQLSPLLPSGYHAVASTSLAVGRADPASCPATDQRGVTRPQGAACDIGAVEHMPSGPAASLGVASGSNQRAAPSLPFRLPFTVYVIDVNGNPVAGVAVTFTAPVSGPSGTFADTHNNITVATTNSSGVATSSVFTANSQMGSYNVVAAVPGVPESASISLTNVAWFVAPIGSDTNSCGAPDSPCLTLNSAMAKASAGDPILVARGTYPPIVINKSLTLLGGWDSTFTSQTGHSTIQGNPTSHGISVSGTEVFISRFVVQNSEFGLYHSGTGMLHFDQGASINNNNGLYNYSGDTIFTNITISGNHAGDTEGYIYGGSAISLIDGTVRIQYSTITNNGGTEAISIGNPYQAHLEIGNSILAGNPISDCDGEELSMSSLGHNIFGSVPPCQTPVSPFILDATDKMGIDPKLLPLFSSGFHPLLNNSLAIDAADPLDCPAVDQRGVTRPVGAGCDIGAFEYSASGTTPQYIYAYNGSPQLIVTNSAAASRLTVLVLDEDGDSVQGKTVTFMAPADGASVIFTDTGTHISTAVTDVNGFATSSSLSANSMAGSYVVTATVDGVETFASFYLGNSSIALNPRIRTYTANNSTGLPGTFLCNETKPGCTSGFDIHADAAHKYAIGTYSLYAIQHSRRSIDNAEMTVISSVHYGSAYANAGWTGSQMVYGDTFDYPLADDVVAHELTHGVTQYESDLFYYYQSGAINESFSDLWGEYYDQINGEGNDTVDAKWLIGEDVYDLGAIRSLSNPPVYGDPDKISSANYYTGTSDNGGVHTNSGVNNKAVFLLVEGGSFNGKAVSALGWDKTTAIYYEANTNLLSSGADYSDLYYALQQACTNLTGQKGITADDCAQVKNAVDAVEMNGQPVPEFNTDAPYCDLGASTVTLFSDDMESGTGNWTFNNGAYPRWQLDSPYGRYAHSGSHSLFADDYPDDAADASARLAAMPIPDNAYLHFAHAYDFDAYEASGIYDDGGVLEYSIDNGSTWLDAGSLIDFNGYRGTIRTDPYNPLQDRSAFVGSSHGYISTRLNLASLAGETVIFRWRMGLDRVGYVWGWWVDDVNLYQCVTDTSAPTVTSIVRAGADPTSAASVDFTVTFSEPVAGVDISDFALDTTGNIDAASIAAVNGSGAIWTVSVTTGSGNGTLGLRVPVDADIQDAAGNSLDGLPFTGIEQYTVDKTAPVLSSILRMGANPTHADSVAFQVNFSKPVTGVDSPDFSLYFSTGNITDAAIESVAADASCTAYCHTYVVTVNTGSGNGGLGLVPILPNATMIVDAAGNLLGEGPFYTEAYLVDKAAPVVSSIVRAGANPTAADSVDFTVTFSEEVASVNTAAPFGDFVLSTTGIPGAAITEIRGSGSTWTVTVNTGSGDGTLGLDLAMDASITDLAGNLLQQGPFAPDEEYMIDKTHAFLIAPANGDALLYRRPAFDWSDVPGASGYRITASRSSSFNTIIWEVETTDSIYIPGADLPGGRVIYWWVRAQVNDALGPWSETWSFTTGNPPSIPTLSSPANASLTTDYTPLLNWSDATVPTGAAAFDHYQVQVATDTLFSDPVLIDEDTAAGQISASSYTPITDLAANTTYYWRVRSFNVSGQYSSWSTVRSFRTALLPPAGLTPDGGVTVSSRQPVLDWDAVEGAEGYTVQISTSSGFSSLLVNTSTTTDTFTPGTNLPANRTIYWRVRATGANGPSRWTTASFKTP